MRQMVRVASQFTQIDTPTRRGKVCGVEVSRNRKSMPCGGEDYISLLLSSFTPYVNDSALKVEYTHFGPPSTSGSGSSLPFTVQLTKLLMVRTSEWATSPNVQVQGPRADDSTSRHVDIVFPTHWRSTLNGSMVSHRIALIASRLSRNRI